MRWRAGPTYRQALRWAEGGTLLGLAVMGMVIAEPSLARVLLLFAVVWIAQGFPSPARAPQVGRGVRRPHQLAALQPVWPWGQFEPVPAESRALRTLAHRLVAFMAGLLALAAGWGLHHLGWLGTNGRYAVAVALFMAMGLCGWRATRLQRRAASALKAAECPKPDGARAASRG